MLQATLAEGKWSHLCASPSLFTLNASFCYFTVKCGFPPKIRTMTFIMVLVQWSIKALGGIRIVIILISTDSILVDHTSLVLMGSTGRHLEVIIIPWNVLRWSWGRSSNRKSLVFFVLVEKHQFSFTYLRVNNGTKNFSRCDISQLLIFLTLCSIW